MHNQHITILDKNNMVSLHGEFTAGGEMNLYHSSI